MTFEIPPLLSNQDRALLDQLQSQVDNGTLETANVALQLRKQQVEGTRASVIATQLALRAQAVTKFGETASKMLFTRQGLEQATRSIVAELHARRLQDCGIKGVADLGCGIGGDSIAFARLGIQVKAIENDLTTAQCAAANLSGFPNAKVILADLHELTPRGLQRDGIGAVYLDPARRIGNVRIQNPAKWSPPLPVALAWHSPAMQVGIKVAPGIKHSDLPANFHAQWVCIGKELVECALWSPGLSNTGPGRSAAIWQGEQWTFLKDSKITSANQPSLPSRPGPLDQWIFEPNPAIIRAGLIGYLVKEIGLYPISDGIAYLTGTLPDRFNPAYFRAYKVIEVCKLRPKAISAALLRLGATSVEIKKRGVDIEPSALRGQLKLSTGDNKLELTVILTRLEGQHSAVITQRLDS